MELVHSQVQHNEYTARLVNYENAHLKVAQLHIPGMNKERSGHMLELVEYVYPKCDPTDTATCRPGSAHLAFQVADAWAEYRRMKDLGVRFKSEPNQSTAGINKGGLCAIFLILTTLRLKLFNRHRGELCHGRYLLVAWRTQEQKTRCIEEITHILVEHGSARREDVLIIFQNIEAGDAGRAGKVIGAPQLASQGIRRRRAKIRAIEPSALSFAPRLFKKVLRRTD